MSQPRGIHAIGTEDPDRLALVHGTPEGDARVSYGELNDSVNRIAHALVKVGVGPGDRVAVMLNNRPELFAVWNAVARLGAMVVPVSYRAVAPEVTYLLDDSGAVAFIHDNEEIAGPAAAAAHDLAIHDIEDDVLKAGPTTPPREDYLGTFVSWMAYTSGTTGRPKGIERQAPQPAQQTPPNRYMEYWGFGRDDVHLMTGPAYHMAPGAYAQMHLVEGAPVVIMPRWRAEESLRLIAQYRVTSTHMVPANFIRILELSAETRARYDLSSLRKVLHAAAPCPVPVKRQIMDVLPPDTVWEYYGASEGMGTVISPKEWLAKPGSVGKPFPGLAIRILDEAGEEVPAGQIGRIYLRPNSGAEPRYRNAPKKTRDAYRGRLFTVGDLGHVDRDGYLFIADRRTDLILRGGVNIYPAEIEGALAEHDEVVDAAVVGVDDARLGQRVRAVVELRPGAERNEHAIRTFLAERLADFKIPAEILFLDHLPREPNGKIRKQQLR